MDLSELITSLPISNYDLPDPSLLQFYENLDKRIYWIGGNIDDSMLDLIDRIIDWNRTDKGLPIEDRKPIYLYIDSPGGELDRALTLCSIIELSKTPVHAIGLGLVASAASLIYLSCEKRFILPNTSFVFHEGSCDGIGGSYAEIKSAMEDYDKKIEKMTNFYIEHTNYTEDEVRTNIKKDWYIYAAEAKEKNIATNIITSLDDIL